jgi:hypothetical protein
MGVGGMIQDKIHYYADITLMRHINQGLDISQRPKDWVNIVIAAMS